MPLDGPKVEVYLGLPESNRGCSFIPVISPETPDFMHNPIKETLAAGRCVTDVTSFGNVEAVMDGVDAVINLAAIPNPIGHLPHHVFSVNMSADFNILEFAKTVGILKIARAPSINALGAAFNEKLVSPRYIPLDEEHAPLSGGVFDCPVARRGTRCSLWMAARVLGWKPKYAWYAE